eukprot:349649-Chlamydomonas_euryale.AAC.3
MFSHRGCRFGVHAMIITGVSALLAQHLRTLGAVEAAAVISDQTKNMDSETPHSDGICLWAAASHACVSAKCEGTAGCTTAARHDNGAKHSFQLHAPKRLSLFARRPAMPCSSHRSSSTSSQQPSCCLAERCGPQMYVWQGGEGASGKEGRGRGREKTSHLTRYWKPHGNPAGGDIDVSRAGMPFVQPASLGSRAMQRVLQRPLPSAALYALVCYWSPCSF